MRAEPKPAYAWTKPFYGVTHLIGVKKGYQVTVNEYDRFADAFIFRTDGFTIVAQRLDNRPKAAAKTWAETQARRLKILDSPQQAPNVPGKRTGRKPKQQPISLQPAFDFS